MEINTNTAAETIAAYRASYAQIAAPSELSSNMLFREFLVEALAYDRNEDADAILAHFDRS